MARPPAAKEKDMRTFAYLDPGTGSMILQGFIAGIAGIAVLFKVGGRRILALFSPKRRAALRAQQAAGDETEATEVEETAETEPASASSSQ
jgi:hypothetical protein